MKLLLAASAGWLFGCSDRGAGIGSLAESTTREHLRDFAAEAEGRASHTATLLADGTVLVAGGLSDTSDSPPTPLASASRYLSAQLGFVSTSDLATARREHTATRLLDGTVLIAGGFDDAGKSLSQAELYDPDADGFVSTGGLVTARGRHTATLLGDGRVLVVGGVSSASRGATVESAEIYDPTTSTFSELVARPLFSGAEHLALTLADGSVLIHWSGSRQNERFDPSEDRFVQAATLPDIGIGPLSAVTRLADESLLVFGATGFALADAALTGATRACPSGQTDCDGVCVDLSSPDNCGTCGNVCGSGFVCSGGECSCQVCGYYYCNPGLVCDGVCADPLSDRNHCGSCGNVCAAGQQCQSGTCVNCSPGLTQCGGTCVDLNADPTHCGTCDTACSAVEWCNGGECDCIGSVCDGKCVSTSDRSNCGGCGIQCPAGWVCGGGYCEPCEPPMTACPGSDYCVGTQWDPANCGGCGHACTVGQQCMDGECETRCADEWCTDSEICFKDRCVPRSPDHADAAAPWGLSRSSGAVWATNRSIAWQMPESSTADLGNATTETLESDAKWSFGGPFHTSTAMPDGSVLVVDGGGTPTSRRLSRSLEGQDAGHGGAAGSGGTTGFAGKAGSGGSIGSAGRAGSAGPTGSPPPMSGATGPAPLGTVTGQSVASAALADGRVLIAAANELYVLKGTTLGVVGSVPGATTAIGLVTQPSGDVLMLHATDSGVLATLVDPSDWSSQSLDLSLAHAGSLVPLGNGAAALADASGIAWFRPSAGGGDFEVGSLDVDLGCSEPALARLPSGRVLVIGNRAYYELDLRSSTLSDRVVAKQPRCEAAPVVRADGRVLIIGGIDDDAAPSGTIEIYDPSLGRTETTGQFNPSIQPFRAFDWFDQPLFGQASSVSTGGWPSAIASFDWQRDSLSTVGNFVAATLRLLPSGRILSVDWTAANALFALHFGAPGPEPTLPSAMPALTMGQEVDFDATFPGHPFPGATPEGSTGATANSATNLPVPAWFPADGGRPSLGTLTKRNGKSIYRVPKTPYPGLGLLFLTANGQLTGLGPVTIAPLQAGAECTDGGECESLSCADGVCCDAPCDGLCEACSRAAKGHGTDGVCEFIQAGKREDRCEIEEARTCRQDGTCDGAGHCAAYADGTVCRDNGTCQAGACVVVTPGKGEAGAGGEPAGLGATGGTAGNGGAPSQGSGASGGTEGAALGEPCRSNRDCKVGVCSTKHVCEPVLVVTKTSGCGCRAARREGGAAGAALPMWLLLAYFARRRIRLIHSP